jgi:hypothetical protein
MTLGEELRRKYALTSFRARGEALALLAINDALEAAAVIADEEHCPGIAARIRALKWAANPLPGVPAGTIVSASNSA